MAQENEDGAEKTEEPTARKLEKGKEDGQIARSSELGIAGGTIVGLLVLLLAGGYFVTELAEVFKGAFAFDRKIIFSPNLLPVRFIATLGTALFIFAPLFFLLVFIAIVSGSALGGLNFSIKAMMPKASKLNPKNGLKRMFGIQSIINLFKSLLKFILVAGTMYLVVRMEYLELLTLSQMSLEPALAKAGAIIIRSALLVALTLLIIAAIDIPIQIHQFTEGMKMTLQEVKDEMKDIEGRPEVKQKIKQRQREIAASQMMEKVKDADVVITNPEHFSVALSYDPASDGAPIVLAKGADLMAFRIRDEAQKHGIQIFSAPPLARALFFTTEIDQPVHPDLYYAVAQVIAYVFNLNSISSGGLPPQKPQPDIPSSMEFDENGNSVENTL